MTVKSPSSNFKITYAASYSVKFDRIRLDEQTDTHRDDQHMKLSSLNFHGNSYSVFVNNRSSLIRKVQIQKKGR